MSYTKQPVSRFLAGILSVSLASASLSPVFARTQDDPVITEDAEGGNTGEMAANAGAEKNAPVKTLRVGVEDSADEPDHKETLENGSWDGSVEPSENAQGSYAQADDAGEEDATETDGAGDDESGNQSGEDASDDESDGKEGEEEEDTSVPFDQTQSVGSVRIHITASEGVFPEGASFTAEEVSDSDVQDSLDAAADDLENAATEVAKQYCYDITIFDKDGNEIEPDASHGYPEVSFVNFDEVSDPNLNAEAYHISDEYQATLLYDSSCFDSGDAEDADSVQAEEKTADEEEAEEKEDQNEKEDVDSSKAEEDILSDDESYDDTEAYDGAAITVSADSFSYYVIRFTYDKKQYDVNPGDTVSLSAVLSAVGLSGSPSAVTTNDADHVSIKQNDSDYDITVSDELITDSSVTVTINDTDYVINLLVTKSDFYGVLFEDGTLAILNGDTDAADLEAEHGSVQHTCPLSESQTTVPGWSKYKEEIRHVIFPDVFRPVNMADWFNGCSNLEDFSVGSLDTSKCQVTSQMFMNCTSLDEIDLSGIDTSSLFSAQGMFCGCTNLVKADLSSWKINYFNSAFQSMFYGCTALTWLIMDSWQTGSVPTGSLMGLSGTDMVNLNTISMKGLRTTTTNGFDSVGWFQGVNASRIYIDNLYAPSATNLLKCAFYGCKNLREVGAYNLYVPNMNDISSMFYSCNNLTSCSIDIHGRPFIDHMEEMFNSCYHLSSIILNGIGINGNYVYSGLFYSCSNLRTINLDDWVIIGDYLKNFSGITGLDRVSSLESVSMRDASINNVNSLYGMFANCAAKTIDISNWKSSRANAVSNFQSMFNNCTRLSRIVWGDFITSNGASSPVRNYTAMFTNCSSLEYIDLKPLWGQRVSSLKAMFCGSGVRDIGLESLTIVKDHDANWDLDCFMNCNYLENINISNWTIYGEDCSYIFPYLLTNSSYHLEQIVADNWSLPDAQILCYACGPTTARILSIQNWNCPKVKNLAGLFEGDSDLQFIDWGTSWDASPVCIDFMFVGCSSMASVDFGKIPINFENITSAERLCSGMSALSHVNLCDKYGKTGKYTFSELTDVEGMFGGCQKLTSVDLSSIDSSKITTYKDWMDRSGVRKITLGGKWVFNSGEDNQLPFEKWKNAETKNMVKLWDDYDGSTMAGTYIRVQDNPDPLELNSVYDGLSYDKESRTLLAYVSPTKSIPASICIPESAEYYQLDADYIKASYNKTCDLYNDISSDFDGTPLTLNTKSVAYLSNTSCSKENNTIWTFDVPKDNTVVTRMDIYTGKNYDQLYGYIINSAEHPEKFTLFDSNGAVMEELNAGTRHTYKDLGYIGSYDVTASDGSVTHYDYKNYGSLRMTDDKLTDHIYPAYEDYLSYDSSMNNYEVVMPPSNYKLEIYNPDQQGIRLTPEKVTTKEVTKKDSDGNEVTETVPDKYIYAAVDAEEDISLPVDLTIGNKIYEKYAYVSHSLGYQSFTVLVKQNEYGSKLSGAAYGFWAFDDGEEDSVDLTKSPTMTWSTNNNGEIEIGRMTDSSKTNYIAKEIHAPSGYTLDDTAFVIYHPYSFHSGGYGSTEVSVYADAIVTADKNNCVCQEDQFSVSCTCDLFGSCSCYCCGGYRSTNMPDTKNYIYRTDSELSSLSLQKSYDDSFGQYDKSKITFTFLLEDLTDGTSKEYTLRAGRSTELSELVDKHKYRLTEMAYSPDGYTPLNNKIGSSGTVEDYITSCEARNQNQSAGPAGGFVANGNSCTFIYNSGASVSQTIEFTNHKNIHTRNLTVAKKVDFSNSSQKTSSGSFSFTLALSNDTLDDLSAQEMTWKKSGGTTGSVTLTDGCFTFSLKDGENIQFAGIPDHTDYTVTEDETSGYIASCENAEGTIYGSDASVTVTNQKVDLENLPVTGGNGRGGIYLSGLILLSVSAALYLRKKHSGS